MRAKLLIASLASLLVAASGAITGAAAQTPDPHQHHGAAAAPPPAAAAPPPAPAGPGAPSRAHGQPGQGHGMMGEAMPGPAHHRMMREMMQRMASEKEGGHDGMAMGAGPTDPVVGALEAINRRMHRDMMPTEGQSPDVAFVTGMIPHHQGAIDMAKLVLAFGEDPEIKKLAEAIIAAQDQEIALMRAWLAKQPR